MVAPSSAMSFWVTSAQEKRRPDGESSAANSQASQMLDLIYKNSIVLITKEYVNDEEVMPAGTAFKKVFEAAEKGGFHKNVRLLDATGEAYNDVNLPNDEFEKSAIAALKKASAWYEKEIEKDGARLLRGAIPIPVVMNKCIMCHDNYEGVKNGNSNWCIGLHDSDRIAFHGQKRLRQGISTN